MDSTIIIAPLYWAHHCGVGKILSTTGTKLALTIKAGATISTGLTTHMHLLCVLDQLCNSISGITMGWEKSGARQAQNLQVITIHNYLCCTDVLCTWVQL